MKSVFKGLLFNLILLFLISFISIASAADNCNALYGDGSQQFILATGSPGELGLPSGRAHLASSPWRCW